jgi:hypothetical protein
VQATPGTFPAIVEGENSVAFGTTISNSNSSNGSFRRATWPDAQNHGSLFFQWTLSSALLSQAKGNYFRLLARFANAPTGTIFIKGSLRYPADTPITTARNQRSAAEWQFAGLGHPALTAHHTACQSCCPGIGADTAKH